MTITKEMLEEYSKKINSLEENTENNTIVYNIAKIFDNNERMKKFRDFNNLKQSCDLNRKNLDEKGMTDKVIKAIKLFNNQNVVESKMVEENLLKLSEEIKKMEENVSNKKLLKETYKIAYPAGSVSSKYESLKSDVAHLITNYLKISKSERKDHWDKDRKIVNKVAIKNFISSYEELKEEELKKELKKCKKEKPKKEISNNLEM